MTYLLLCLAVVFITSWLLHFYLQNKKHHRTGALGKDATVLEEDKILFVIAHPDDEAMFFAPSIMCLIHSGKKVHLLCLTTGNYYGKGQERTMELYKSIRILGMNPDNVHLINNKAIQDGNKSWDLETTTAVIQDCVKNNNIQLVITFDEYGVSGHVNHVSAYYAVRNLISKEKLNSGIKAFKLESTNILRKYSGLLDVPYSWLLCDQNLLFINSWKQVWTAQDAMRAHHSQYVWFRKIYIYLSRYMLINTLKPITVLEDHTKHDKDL